MQHEVVKQVRTSEVIKRKSIEEKESDKENGKGSSQRFQVRYSAGKITCFHRENAKRSLKQVVNHGMGSDVMSEMMRVSKEFFNLPFDERAIHYSEDIYKPVRLFTSTGVHDIVHFWRDCLRMSIYPVEDFKQYWPENPSNLKDAVENYARGSRKLSTTVLGLVAEGLGLDRNYFDGDLSGEPMASHINFYPPCPDPSLTLGLAKHCDPGLITLLLQGNVSGLQILHNDEWIAVDPVPMLLLSIMVIKWSFKEVEDSG
ncbi:hypothetical protein HPP92_022513 [Vanilla planifolia]|uniref:Uncharacterized protein n=1 Tax=Vanilla planifolia TaxID=51239 RepID=A0A835UFQ8_VANPL|nr:hypothetical protein HPP92_022513 [Vanilla planifolia]